jgi:hypothetical protein
MLMKPYVYHTLRRINGVDSILCSLKIGVMNLKLCVVKILYSCLHKAHNATALFCEQQLQNIANK